MLRERMTVIHYGRRGLLSALIAMLAVAGASTASARSLATAGDSIFHVRAPEGETVQEMQKRHRAMFKDFQGSKERYRKDQKDFGSTILAPTGPIPLSGTLSTLVLLAGADPAHSPNEFDDLFFSVGTYFEGPTADASGTRNGSFRDYVLETSYGNLDIEGQVRGWYPGVSGSGGGFVQSAVQAADPFIDYGRFDNDGPDGVPRAFGSTDDDGIIDFLIVIYSSGIAPPSGFGIYEAVPDYVTDDGVIIDHGYMVPEQVGVVSATEENLVVPVGAFPYGMGIRFGLPDATDEDGTSQGTGIWDPMDVGGLLAPEDYLELTGPAHFAAYGKKMLGWLVPQAVETGQTVTLDAAALIPDAVQAFRRNNVNTLEHFLIEYKSNEAGSIFDRGYPLGATDRGFLIWHMDEALLALEDPFLINNDESRPFVMLEQADGEFDLQKPIGNIGDPGDPWPGSTNADLFATLTVPSTKDYEGKPTGLAVSGFSPFSSQAGRVTISFDTFAPTLTIVNPGAVPVGPVRGDVEIRWRDSDPDSNARVSFYYSTVPDVTPNAEGLEFLQTPDFIGEAQSQGAIQENIPEDSAANRIVWNTLDPLVAQGSYFIYGVIEDENNLVLVRSQAPVMVERETPPLIEVIEPNGENDFADESYTIRWIDSADADAVVRIYYDLDDSGTDGVEITEEPIPALDAKNFLVWDTSEVFPATYFIYATIQQPGGGTVVAYSEGPITIDHPPTISITTPGAQDETATGSFTICWNDFNEGGDATVSLYYNTEPTLAGAVLITGASDISEDDFVDCFLWNTTNVPPGCYYVIGLIEDDYFRATSASIGRVCTEDVPPEARLALHDLTRQGQAIEATSPPTAIIGIDANAGGTNTRLESIDLQMLDFTPTATGSFDADVDLREIFGSSSQSGLALYRDTIALSNESQFAGAVLLFASDTLSTPFGTGDIVAAEVEVGAPTLEEGDQIFLSGSPDALTPFVALTSLRIDSGTDVTVLDLVEPRGDFVYVDTGELVEDNVPLHDPLNVTDLLAEGGSIEIVLKSSSPYLSRFTNARVTGNTDIYLVLVRRLPDLTTQGIFNIGDEIVPIQDIGIVNDNTIRIIPLSPPLLPTSNTGQSRGDDFFLVIRTSEDIEFLDTFRARIPQNGVRTSNGPVGQELLTNEVTANPPTFIDPPVYLDEPLNQTIALEQPFEPQPIFRISMSDNGQPVFLKSIRVNFLNFQGFTPATDLIAMATEGGGVGLFRDSDSDGLFSPGLDEEITLAQVPQISGGNTPSVKLELPSMSFPVPDDNDRAPEVFVVIRPSQNMLSGDRFRASIPSGGILYDFVGGTPPVIASSESAQSMLHEFESNGIQLELVDLTSYGKRVERTSEYVPVVGIRVWDPEGGVGTSTIESIKMQIVPVGGNITASDFIPSVVGGAGGIGVFDAVTAGIHAGTYPVATDTGGAISVPVDSQRMVVYDRTELEFPKLPKSRVYLSGAPNSLAPFIVGGAIRINGNVAKQIRGYSGLTGFYLRGGDITTDLDLVWEPSDPVDITEFFKNDDQTLTFELVGFSEEATNPDIDRIFTGNTDVYVVEVPEGETRGFPTPDADVQLQTLVENAGSDLTYKISFLENLRIFEEPLEQEGSVDYYIGLRTSETIDYLDSFRVRIPKDGVVTSRGVMGREMETEVITANPPTFISDISRSPSETIALPHLPHGVYGIGMSDSGRADQYLQSVEVHLHNLVGFSRVDLDDLATEGGGVALYRDYDGDGHYDAFIDEPVKMKPPQFLGVDPIRIILEPAELFPLPDVNDDKADLFVAVSADSSMELGTAFSVEIPKRGIRYQNVRSDEEQFSAAFVSEINQPPFIELLTPEAGGEAAGDSFRILWNDADPDNNAFIEIYFSARGDIVTERELLTSDDVHEILEFQFIPENDETDALDWDTSEANTDIEPGVPYYIYARIFDSQSSMITRSPGFVRVTRSDLLTYLKLTDFGHVFTPGGYDLLGNAPLGLNRTATDLEVTRDEEGYVILDESGELYRFGIVPPVFGLEETAAPAVDIEFTADDNGAYILLADGTVVPAGAAVGYGSPTLDLDVPARDIEVTHTGNGYIVMDANGRSYSFGDAPRLDTAFIADGLARDLELTPSDRGAFVLDAFGAVYALGDAPDDLDPMIYGWDIARDLEIVPGEVGVRAILILDGNGNVQQVGDVVTLYDPYFMADDMFIDLEVVNVPDIYQTALLDVLHALYSAISREDTGDIGRLLSRDYSDDHGNDYRDAIDFLKNNFRVYEWQQRFISVPIEEAIIQAGPNTGVARVPTEDLVFLPFLTTFDLERGSAPSFTGIEVGFTQRVYLRKRLDGRGFQVVVYDVDLTQEFDENTSPNREQVTFRDVFDEEGDEREDFLLRYEGADENNLYTLRIGDSFSGFGLDDGLLELFTYNDPGDPESVAEQIIGGATGAVDATDPINIVPNVYQWDFANEGGVYRIVSGDLYQFLPTWSETSGPIGFRFDLPGPIFDTRDRDSDFRYVDGEIQVTTLGGGVLNLTLEFGITSFNQVDADDINQITESEWFDADVAAPDDILAIRTRNGRTYGLIKPLIADGEGILFDWVYRDDFIITNPPSRI